MSYCRFIDDDMQCDLYVYENETGGYTAHVRGARPVFSGPLPRPVQITAQTVGQWHQRHIHVHSLISGYQPIGGPHDAQTFYENTPQQMIDRLLALREAGYRFPDYVIDALMEQAA